MSAPALRSITNELDIAYTSYPSASNSIEFVDMPMLEIIGSYLRVYYAVALKRINLPNLVSVGGTNYYSNGYLTIQSNSALQSVNFTNLTTVSGSLSIQSNQELLRVNFSELVTVSSSISISSNSKLEDLFMFKLATSGQFYVQSNGALTQLSLPSLTTVSGMLQISYNSVMLRADVMATQIYSGLLVYGNTLMENLYFDRLAYIGTLYESACASGSYEDICIYSNDALVNATFPLLNLRRSSDSASKGTFIPFGIHAQFADYTWWFGGASYATAPRPDLFDNPAGSPTLGVNDSTTCVGDAIPYTTNLLLCDLSYFINASTVRKITGALRIRGPAYMLGTSLAPSFDYPQLNATGTQLQITGLTSQTNAIRMPSLNVIGTDFWYIYNDESPDFVLSLPTLHNIQNDLWYKNCGSQYSRSLYDFNLPTLYSIGNDLIIQSNYGNRVTMAQMQTIGGYLYLWYNYGMTSVSLVSLQTVGEYIDIYYNSQSYYDIGIKRIELNSLQSFGSYMNVRDNDELKFMNLTSLQTVPQYRACATPPLARARLVLRPD